MSNTTENTNTAPANTADTTPATTPAITEHGFVEPNLNTIIAEATAAGEIPEGYFAGATLPVDEPPAESTSPADESTPAAEQAATPAQTEQQTASSDADELAKARKILAAAHKEARKAKEELKEREAAKERELIDLARKSPSQFLEKTGITAEEFFIALANESSLSGEQPQPTEPDRIAALEKKLQDQEAAKQHEINSAKVVNEFQTRLSPEKYPNTAALGEKAILVLTAAAEDAYQRNKAAIDSGQEQLTFEYVLEQVEEHLAFETWKANKTPKSTSQPQQTNQATKRQPSQTITNTYTRTAPPSNGEYSYDPDERLRQILAEEGFGQR